MKPIELWRLTVQTSAAWNNDDALQLGVALAYYAVFSISPLLIILAAAGLLRTGVDDWRFQRLYHAGPQNFKRPPLKPSPMTLSCRRDQSSPVTLAQVIVNKGSARAGLLCRLRLPRRGSLSLLIWMKSG